MITDDFLLSLLLFINYLLIILFLLQILLNVNLSSRTAAHSCCMLFAAAAILAPA